jgi:hypothetical protein
VIVGLDGDYRQPQARQNLLRLSQRQPQPRDLAEATKWPDFLHINARVGANGALGRSSLRAHAAIAKAQAGHTHRARLLRSITASSWTLPRQ